MNESELISRVSVYFRRHGLWATACRVALAARRTLMSPRLVLLYCELSEKKTWPPQDFLSPITIEQKRNRTELNPEDLQAMTSFWNPRLANRNINKRFSKGAVLWLIRSEDQLAGYGWTLQAGTIEPHYFPLGQHDVHLFDFYVFPQHRGQRMNPFLVNHILRSLTTESSGRAFIEAAEWNKSQLSSLRRTPFRSFGRARKWTAVGHHVVWWTWDETVQSETNQRVHMSDSREHVRFLISK